MDRIPRLLIEQLCINKLASFTTTPPPAPSYFPHASLRACVCLGYYCMLQGEIRQTKKKGGRRAAFRLVDFKEPTQVMQMREHRKKHISEKEGWGQASLLSVLFMAILLYLFCGSIRPSIYGGITRPYYTSFDANSFMIPWYLIILTWRTENARKF